MTARKSGPNLAERTPIAEWTAAALGLVLTLGVIGYTVWEGLTEDDGPPRLSISSGPPARTAHGFVVPIVVRNASHATAAQVEIEGVLAHPGRPAETRRASFAYVPGRGEARGGLVFHGDPAASKIAFSVSGYADP